MDHNKLLKQYLGDPQAWWARKTCPLREKIESLIDRLETLKQQKPSDYYVLHCLSDAYFILNDYRNALINCPKPEISAKWYLLANRRINLCILANEKVNIYDLLALFNKQVTKYGQQNIEIVSQVSQIILEQWERDKDILIMQYMIEKHPPTPKQIYMIFNGTVFSRPAFGNVMFYKFEEDKELEETIATLSREAENTVREDKGLPKIGEGWISEARLYYEIKEILPKYEVLFHGRPNWLGKQHLDIYIPQLALAFEYQGRQHYEPVDYFGGLEAFLKIQKLDSKKLNLCQKMGVEIVYVKEGYDIHQIKQQILEFVKLKTET
jgi:hypothetical protein